MTTVYYAHSMAIYGTPREMKDINMLSEMGFEVVNPSSPGVVKGFEKYKEIHQDDYMTFFTLLAAACDVVAFRALPDGRIPGGVAKEIAANTTGFLIELPNRVKGRSMNHEETVEYLEDIGER
jgi:hypothetical protein